MMGTSYDRHVEGLWKFLKWVDGRLWIHFMVSYSFQFSAISIHCIIIRKKSMNLLKKC